MQRPVQRQIKQCLAPVFMPYVIKHGNSSNLKSKCFLKFLCNILVLLTRLQLGFQDWCLCTWQLLSVDWCLTKVEETWTIQLHNGHANAFPEITICLSREGGGLWAVSWATIVAVIADLLVSLPFASWDIQLIRLNLFLFVSIHPGLIV